MKQLLHFLDEADFQSFVAQLFSEELPLFQTIEGAGYRIIKENQPA